MKNKPNWCKTCSIAYGGGDYPKYPRGQWPCVACADNSLYTFHDLSHYPHYYTTKPFPKDCSLHDFAIAAKEENERKIQQALLDNYYRTIAENKLKGY